MKCELCGDPATTWNCFGDGPKRVCKGCDDSINKFYKTKCDLTCMKEKKIDSGLRPKGTWDASRNRGKSGEWRKKQSNSGKKRKK